tara:strand:+ start:84 stop:347 length:264 start_codon:yes stop_codon:yes gene_type:complete
MANPMQSMKTTKKVVEAPALREKMGVLDFEGKLIPLNDAKRRLMNEASKLGLDDMEGAGYVRDMLSKLGYKTSESKGRAAGGSVEKP